LPKKTHTKGEKKRVVPWRDVTTSPHKFETTSSSSKNLGSFVTQKQVWVPHWTTHTHTHTHIYIYNSHSHEALTKLKNCTCNTHICPNHHQTSLTMICDIKTSLSPHWTLCKIPMLLWFGHHILAIFYGEPSTPKFMDNSDMKQKLLPKLLNIYIEKLSITL